jgi:hypothetical protein
MSDASHTAAWAQLTSDDVARLVAARVAAGNRVLDGLLYVEALDLFLIHSGRLALLIERNFIDEFRNLPAKNLNQVLLSKSGTSIILDKYNIHIEAAGLMVDYINYIKKTGAGGSIMDLLQGGEPH